MKIRVYYEDTDCGNVVYYANYLRYMERGRTEFMREKGVSFAHYHRNGMLFTVAEASLKYHAPAYYDDLVDMTTTVRTISRASIIFHTTFTNEKGLLLVAGEVKVACITKEGKLQRIPQKIIELLG